MQMDGRPRVSVPPPKTWLNPGNSKNVPEVPKPQLGGPGQANVPPKPVPVPREVGKRCVFCSSPNHLIAACPHRKNVYVANKQTPRLQVNSMVVSGNTEEPRPQVNAMVVNSNKEEPKSQVTVVTSSKEELVPSANRTEVYDVEVTSDDELLLAEGWSQMHYVEVNIEGLSDKVTALNDSGCQLCVVRADVTEPLQLPKLGEAKLKGISNEIVPADIGSVRMRLAQGNGYINIPCAVVKNLSHCLILGSDVVDRLNVKLCDEQSDAVEIDVDELDNDIDNDVTDVNVAHCSDDVCDDVPVGEHQTTSDGKDEEKVMNQRLI